jgi:hypothetical protein
MENQNAGASRTRSHRPLRHRFEWNSFQPQLSSACEEGAERVDEAHRADLNGGLEYTRYPGGKVGLLYYRRRRIKRMETHPRR